MNNSRFYAAGLKFSCKRCSSCCRYESGYVYLSEKDLEKLMSALKMDRKEFITAYCRWVNGWDGDEVLSLKEKINKDCILWENGCAVYEARPLQCVTYPFWENIIATSRSWETAALACPGMNTGELHTERAINDTVKIRVSSPVISKSAETFGSDSQKGELTAGKAGREK